MTALSLNCRELIEFLSAYLDDELPGEERAAFERHLAVCPYCRDYLATYRQTVHLGKRTLAAEAEALEQVPQELLRAILAARARA